MQIFDVVIAFAALLGICLFLHQICGVQASLTPLASMSIAMLWFVVAGVCGLLVPMGWVFYAMAAIGAAVGCFDIYKKKSLPKTLFSPGFCLFIGTGVVFLVYLALRQPVVSVWDEMSFWGTAAKITKLDNTLYTVSELSQIWEWTATQKPGMIVLGYFVQFFGSGFAAWKLYFVYDLLLFACLAAIVGGLEKKQWSLWIPVAIAAFLSPWFFTVYQRETILRPVYMDSYGDIPAGILAGAAVAFWLCLRKTNSKGLWLVPVVLTAALYVKDNTLPVALMAFGIVGADCLFFCLPREQKTKIQYTIAKRAGFCLSALVCMGVGYMVWSNHAAMAVQLRAEQGGLGTTSMALGQVLKNGVQMLVSPPSVSPDIANKYGAKFVQVSADMADAFFKSSITMAGPCVTALILIALMFGAATAFSPKGQRLRTGLLGGAVVLGFFAYYLVILFSYVFIFKDFQAASLDSYNRYIYPYLLFAFVVALSFLANTSQEHISWKPTSGVVLGLSVIMLFRFSTMLMPQFTVLGYPEAYFKDMKKSSNYAQAVTKAVPEGSRIFYVYQGDDGAHWFRQSYNLLPLITDPSGSVDEEKGWSGGMGGTFGLAELSNGNLYYHAYTPEQLASYLLESGCDYMYIEQLDDIFLQSYQQLFEDGLSNAQQGPALYKIEQQGQLAWMTVVNMEGAA